MVLLGFVWRDGERTGLARAFTPAPLPLRESLENEIKIRPVRWSIQTRNEVTSLLLALPPTGRKLRHGFEGIVLGLTLSRIRLWRSTINSIAITDCPAVSAFLHQVRFNPEREGGKLVGHDRIMQRRRPGR